MPQQHTIKCVGDVSARSACIQHKHCRGSIILSRRDAPPDENFSDGQLKELAPKGGQTVEKNEKKKEKEEEKEGKERKGKKREGKRTFHRTSVTCDVTRGRRANARPGGRGS